MAKQKKSVDYYFADAFDNLYADIEKEKLRRKWRMYKRREKNDRKSKSESSRQDS